MNTYQITRITGDPDWNAIPTLEVSNVLWLPDVGVRMTQQLCYDDGAIYVHQRAVEQSIRAENNESMAQACEDSCMEFFFCPDPKDGRYFNFEITPKGFTYIGLCKNRNNFARLFPGNAQTLFDIRPAYTPDGWELFYRIPLPFIQLFFPDFQLKPGAVLRANCYKCGDLTVQPHYLAWNPCTSPNPDFHRPQDFGTMVLI